MVNQIPDKGICPEEHRDEGSLFTPNEGCLSRVASGTGFSLCGPQRNRDSANEPLRVVCEFRFYALSAYSVLKSHVT
jgi:hypothetical protein